VERTAEIYCDGCGGKPSVWAWIRAELTSEGYSNWRHPAIAFQAAGCPMTYNTRGLCERLFKRLFNRLLPEEPSYLCPRCQDRVAAELPDLMAQDHGPRQRDVPRHY